MPLLGSENNDDFGPENPAQRQAAIAYPRGNFGPMNLLAILASLLILRNLLFHDYRDDLVSQLQSLGQTSEQIERFMPGPKTSGANERSNSEPTSDMQLREDVDYLLTAVKQLQLQVGLPMRNGSAAPAEDLHS